MNKSDLPGDAKHAFVQQRATPAASRTISIAMCTYNGDRFLREQSESILNQTRLPDHLIVCDDGSTDTTRSLLEQFARKSPFPVELRFNSRNLGVTRNFEQALMACRSDFIALCDQDDLWHPRKLERLTEVLEANPQAGFACSNAELIDRYPELCGMCRKSISPFCSSSHRGIASTIWYAATASRGRP